MNLCSARNQIILPVCTSWSFVLEHNLYCQASVVNGDINDFVSCFYENTWWIGLVMEIDDEQTHACVKFMHPHGRARSYHWPEWMTSAGYQWYTS